MRISARKVVNVLTHIATAIILTAALCVVGLWFGIIDEMYVEMGAAASGDNVGWAMALGFLFGSTVIGAVGFGVWCVACFVIEMVMRKPLLREEERIMAAMPPPAETERNPFDRTGVPR